MRNRLPALYSDILRDGLVVVRRRWAKLFIQEQCQVGYARSAHEEFVYGNLYPERLFNTNNELGRG